MLLESISSFIYILFMRAGSLNERGEMTWASVQRLQRRAWRVPSKRWECHYQLEKNQHFWRQSRVAEVPDASAALAALASTLGESACHPPTCFLLSKPDIQAAEICCKIIHYAPPGGRLCTKWSFQRWRRVDLTYQVVLLNRFACWQRSRRAFSW